MATSGDRLRHLLTVLRRVARRFIDDRCLRIASALTFTALLAMVPLFVVVFSAMSMFPAFERYAADLEAFIYNNFVPTAGDVVKENLTQFAAQASRLTRRRMPSWIGAMILPVE